MLAGTGTPGERVSVAWEELARGARPRLREGERVVLALLPLPTASLWRQRFPEGDTRVIAAAGQGFWRDPDVTSLDLVARYLALTPDEREASAGAALLSELGARAPSPLAAAALTRLRSPARQPPVSSVVAGNLVRAAENPEHPLELRRAVVELVGELHVEALHETLVRWTEAGSELRAAAYRALIALDGGISDARFALLLASTDPELRVLAIEQAGERAARPEVAAAISGDADPRVRAAAVRAVARERGVGGLDALEPALFDPRPEVRRAAAEAIGSLGDAAVPRLHRLALRNVGSACAGPVAALALAGPAGRATLLQLSVEHPDPQVRQLARVALGRDPHTH